MISFLCATCGEVHEGLPAFGWDYPVQYLNVPDAERDERTHLTTDTCVIDDAEFYVRARLEIPVHGSPEPMTWGVWVSLSATSYDRFVDLLEEPGREREGSWFGWLCSAVPCYPDTLLLKTRVHVQPVPLRPVVELEPTDHPLAVDQRQGITAERAATIIASVLHPDHRVESNPGGES